MAKFDIYFEFTKIKELCDKYKFECCLRFDEVYIKTPFDSWYFIPTRHHNIKLMHGNTMGRFPQGYHVQFHHKISYDNLLRYIYEHGLGKYKGYKMNFTFDKDGYFIEDKQRNKQISAMSFA